jgi:dienelactone hydrolase
VRGRSHVGHRRGPDRAQGLHLEPVTADTADGVTWDGLLLTPHGGSRSRRRLAIVVVHGSVGNYITGLPRRVAQGLAEAGFTVVSVNTRMANYGVFFGGGLFHETPLDLDAWMGLLRRLGHTRIALLGYSLGASIVTHYQAVRSCSDVVGLCTLAHPASLPRSLERRCARFGSHPDYETVTARARVKLGTASASDEDEIFIVERAAGPTTSPEHAEIWTWRTWWCSRGPEAVAAMSNVQIAHIRVPVALVQAEEDLIVPRADGDELQQIALASGVPDVVHEQIAYANHAFSGREHELVARCIPWLDHLTE